jgi:hypothetical protein
MSPSIYRDFGALTHRRDGAPLKLHTDHSVEKGIRPLSDALASTAPRLAGEGACFGSGLFEM